jgi:hypothetical protein
VPSVFPSTLLLFSARIGEPLAVQLRSDIREHWAEVVEFLLRTASSLETGPIVIDRSCAVGLADEAGLGSSIEGQLELVGWRFVVIQGAPLYRLFHSSPPPNARVVRSTVRKSVFNSVGFGQIGVSVQ